MPRREELMTTVATVTDTDASIGAAVPANLRRYIYEIKAINEYNGANLLTLGKREDGAAVTTAIDYIRFALLYDTEHDPDGPIAEDALPLHIIEGKGSTGDSYLRAVVASGTAYLRVRYVDAP